MAASELNWQVVLVRPRNPLNIGAAARAMANFGFQELVVVAPHTTVWQETRSAVGAEEIVKSARAVNELREAIADTTLVVGTTSGLRRNLDRDLIPLPEMPEWLRGRPEQGRAALLFGSEKTGLSNEQMSYCHALVRIPTTPRCPSMNLGQAVAICCYELACRGTPPVPAESGWCVPTAATAKVQSPRRQPANLESLEHVFARAVRVLDHVGYLKPQSRGAMLAKLRRLLLGLGLTNNDVKILGGILAQIEWKLRDPTSGTMSYEQ